MKRVIVFLLLAMCIIITLCKPTPAYANNLSNNPVMNLSNTATVATDYSTFTTQSLIEMVLESDFFISMISSNVPREHTFDMLTRYNGYLSELTSRDDAVSIMITMLTTSDDLDYSDKASLALLLSQPVFSDSLSTQNMQSLSAYISQNSSNPNSNMGSNPEAEPLTIIDNILSYLFPSNIDYTPADISIETVGGNTVILYEATSELTNAEIVSFGDDMLDSFPNITVLDEPTAKYNCHSYAWFERSSENGYWLNDITPYTMDHHISITSSRTPTVGSICVYYNNNGTPVHSAVVISVTGSTVVCRSKWGQTGLYEHNLTDVPQAYTYDGTTFNCWYYTYTESHTYSTPYTQYSSTQHKSTCKYCDHVEYFTHSFRITNYNSSGHTRTCSQCGYAKTEAHIMNPITGKCKVCSYSGPATSTPEFKPPIDTDKSETKIYTVFP